MLKAYTNKTVWDVVSVRCMIKAGASVAGPLENYVLQATHGISAKDNYVLAMTSTISIRILDFSLLAQLRVSLVYRTPERPTTTAKSSLTQLHLPTRENLMG